MMIAELAHFSLILALLLSLLLFAVPLWGSFSGNQQLMLSAKPMTFLFSICVFLAYTLLTLCFIMDDFSVALVANHGNTLLPFVYKISAVWGSHEGSLLLWILILTFWMLAVACLGRQLPIDIYARVLSILAFIAIGFILFSLLTSNPFLRVLPSIPVQGQDLNPLLQDPGMAIHPPMLYFGYVGFSVAFAFAITALLSGEIDNAWVRWTRPWTTAAWGFLTLGIALGSWWAYYELGWGGWWFWDPVENASFMPWLLGTALMHSLAVTEKRDMFKSWTLLLAIFTFSLSLLGTFLVRSGILTSVHAFAADPTRGVFILIFLLIIVGGALSLFAFRAPTQYLQQPFSFFSREFFLLLNNLLLVIAALTVLVGTLFPLVADFFSLGKFSVGPPYFNLLFVPTMLILFFFLGFGPLLRWKKTPQSMIKKLAWLMLIMVTLTIIIVWLFINQFDMATFICAALVCWLLTSMLFDFYHKLRNKNQLLKGITKLPLSFYAMHLAHLGLLVTAVGIGIVSFNDQQHDIKMTKGDQFSISEYQFQFNGTKAIEGNNYNAIQGDFLINIDGRPYTKLHPEKRFYHSQKSNVMTEAAIDAGISRDLFIALGEQLDTDSWSVRIQYKPYLRLIWLGALMMALAALLAISDKRYRYGKV